MMSATEKMLMSHGVGEVCTSATLIPILRVSRQTLRVTWNWHMSQLQQSELNHA